MLIGVYQPTLASYISYHIYILEIYHQIGFMLLLYCGGLYCDVWLYQRYYTRLTLHKIDSNNNIYSGIPLNKLQLHE